VDLLVKELEGETEISEEEIGGLVLAAREGDAQAFGRMFEMLSSKLHRQAFFLAGDEHQAVDLLQETMIEVWQHLPRYDGRVRFFTWICSIMAHRHYDWLRRLRVRARTVFSAKAAAVEESSAPSPEESADHVEIARVLRECLEELPAKQRAAVYLRFYAGESLEGIAAIAKCSVGTVKSRLFNGLERLGRMRKLKEFQKHFDSAKRNEKEL
jgi:RNA polymerase sigma-70 factor (ECF subfamily)